MRQRGHANRTLRRPRLRDDELAAVVMAGAAGDARRCQHPTDRERPFIDIRTDEKPVITTWDAASSALGSKLKIDASSYPPHCRFSDFPMAVQLAAMPTVM